jgi:Carbohydrate-selective porin, OprB family/S-layer homology domain
MPKQEIKGYHSGTTNCQSHEIKASLSSAILATISVLSVASLVPEAVAMPQPEIPDTEVAEDTKTLPCLSNPELANNAADKSLETLVFCKNHLGFQREQTSFGRLASKITESGRDTQAKILDVAEDRQGLPVTDKSGIAIAPQPREPEVLEDTQGVEVVGKSGIAIASDPDLRIEPNQKDTLFAPLPEEIIEDPLENLLKDSQSLDNSNPDGETNNSLDQVTSVTQLSDVKPTDWAYQALRELVERYGCIAGYPDGTYRGNRAMTRYEFAAGLNACLDSLYRLIGAGASNPVGGEDLDSIKRLQQEFATELSQLTGKVDNLESRIGTLEDNQFSTTLKMNGFIDMSLIDAFSGEGNSETVFQYSVFLPFRATFTGKDRLDFSLVTNNTTAFDFRSTNNGRNVGVGGEGTVAWGFGGSSENNIVLGNLDYTFPIIPNKLIVTVFTDRAFGAGGSTIDSDRRTLGLIPGQAISAFGVRAPLSRITGRSGILARYQINEALRFGVAYEATPGSNPEEGLFNGNYYAVGQMVFTPSDKLGMIFTYGNTYALPGQFKFSRNRNRVNARPFVGSAIASRFDNQGVFFDADVATVTNFYGVQGFYQITPQINIGGFVNKFSSRLIGRGDADIWSYAAMLTVRDVFKQGNIAGLIVGMEPTLTGLRKGNNFVGGFERDTSWHIEAYYKHNINNSMSVTTGAMWITAPNQDDENEDIVMGTVRMQFAF